MKTTNTQITLAHDAFTQYGGAERVFEFIHEIYPTAPVYTLVVDKNYDREIRSWNLNVSPLQYLYNFHTKLTHFFAIIPLVFLVWKPKDTKVLLTASSSYIKGLKKPNGAIHINYCHTPTRFLWVDSEHALKEIPSILHPLAKMVFSWQKKWDLRAANRIDYFIANSKEVQSRIKKIYNRDSEIIHPFVDTNFWKPTTAKKDYFLIAGRLQYAKGLENVIDVFNNLGLPLHVVGTGRYEQSLRKMAKDNIKFLGRTTDEVLRDEYSGALGFIYPQFEDFGIMPLEAASCGTATIGLAKGGSLETIIPGTTGELLQQVNFESLKTAIQNWNNQKYNLDDLKNHAESFSKNIFEQKIKAVVDKFI